MRVAAFVGGGGRDQGAAGAAQLEARWRLLTASLKTAVTVVAPSATPVAPAAGVRLVTVGLVVSAVVGGEGPGDRVHRLPAASRAPLTVAV